VETMDVVVVVVCVILDSPAILMDNVSVSLNVAPTPVGMMVVAETVALASTEAAKKMALALALLVVLKELVAEMVVEEAAVVLQVLPATIKACVLNQNPMLWTSNSNLAVL